MSAFTRAAGAAAAIATAVIGLQLIGVELASAHTNAVTGTAECQQDGTYRVQWTITNQWTTDETAAVTGFAPRGSSLSASSLELAANRSGTTTQTGVPGTATVATLAVHGTWSDATSDAEGRVTLDGLCGTPRSVRAGAPSASDGQCVDNGTTSPAVVIPGATGIAYRLDDRSVRPGTHVVSPGTHVVTATGAGVELVGQHRWTFRLVSAVTHCGVIPETPAVRQSECTGNGASAPSLTVDRTRGITYSVSSSSPAPGDTVTVRATAKSGHVLSDLPSGWRRTSAMTATYKARFSDAPVCSGTDGESDSQGGAGTNSDSTGLAATGEETGGLVFGGFALLLIGSAITFRARRV